MAADQIKKAALKNYLSPPNTLPRKMKSIITTHDIVERFKNKQTLFGGDPPHLVFKFPTDSS
jgi:hypothetical protein